MPDIEDLREKYFVLQEDADSPSYPVPATSKDNKVEWFIGAKAYYNDLLNELQPVGHSPHPEEHRLYIAGWDMQHDVTLDTQNGAQENQLFTILKKKAAKDVDVRVLLWFAPYIIPKAKRPGDNERRIRSAVEFRDKSKVKNILEFGYTPIEGSFHSKMIIIKYGGRWIGYTGGIDLIDSRYDWRDVQVKIKGPAVLDLLGLFRKIWNHNVEYEAPVGRVLMNTQFDRRIPVVEDDTPLVPPGPSDDSWTWKPGEHHVQSLRTLPYPQDNYGVFEIARAWRKAISSADTYVYLENYQFVSEDLGKWIADRVKQKDSLVVIIVLEAVGPYTSWVLQNQLITALEKNSQRERVQIFKRKPVGRSGNKYIHSKTVVVDDQWMFIGSANFSPRSLYTDVEHGVGVVDRKNGIVSDYRTRLWSHHLETMQVNLTDALIRWEKLWKGDITSRFVTPERLPVEKKELSDTQIDDFRTLHADSRSWSMTNLAESARERGSN